jgi:hypothetical protein
MSFLQKFLPPNDGVENGRVLTHSSMTKHGALYHSIVRAGLLALLLLFLQSVALAQVTTTVSDALVQPGGQAATGSLTVTAAMTFTTADGFTVTSGQVVSATLAAGGNFTIALLPTIGAAPYNAFYYADYRTPSARVREQWAVPQSGVAIKLSSVRVLWPQAPNVLLPASQVVPPPTCTPSAASNTNLVLRYTTNPVGWVCAPDNTGAVTMNLENPTPVDAGKFQWTPKNGLTLTQVSCSVDIGTASVNLEVRSASSPNSSGQQVLASALACAPGGASSTSFQLAAVPGASPVALMVTTTSGNPGVVRVSVSYLLN